MTRRRGSPSGAGGPRGALPAPAPLPHHLHQPPDAPDHPDNLDRSPLYAGRIQGVGPALLPLHRGQGDALQPIAIATRSSSSPRGWTRIWSTPTASPPACPWMCSCSLLRSIEGLEHAAIVAPGYAVEYDYVEPRQLRPRCRARRWRGSSAPVRSTAPRGTRRRRPRGSRPGINAARLVAGSEPLVLRRDQAYIGVMIDDLVTAGDEVSPTACSPPGPSTGCCCGRTTPTCG